ncbi:MAG: nodulation protein NfeD [Nitrospirales bacterium]|nr:nodulation protein NfeD [Nitrospira sp.]MDR4503120.1 nodulation protein NfeD [Nitrospirales bacterium]
MLASPLHQPFSSPLRNPRLLVLVTYLLCLGFTAGYHPTAHAKTPLVITASYEGVINPVAVEYLQEVLLEAADKQAALLIFQLDTPGGLDTSMRLMVKDINQSSIPVAVYVAPSGGRAASAGVFLTLAAPFAAMAPGTNIGAAHPVAMGGGEMDEVMKEKVENDAVAYIVSIAERRGRNIEWAENAVRKSVSVPAQEALRLGLIDVVSESVQNLLHQLDGKTTSINSQPVTLHTTNARIQHIPMSWRLEVLKALSDPNIAYILMTIGTIGMIAELYNPGAILPGVVGAISLILAFYSLQTLPVNYAGVLLLILGLVMLMLEVMVTSFGLLAIGGVTALILGSLMLIKEGYPFYQLSWSIIIPMVTLLTGFILLIVTFSLKSLKRRTVTGSEGLIGMTGSAKTDLLPSGQIFVHGELWEAISEAPLRAGDPLEVTGIDGLTLHVKPTAPTHPTV